MAVLDLSDAAVHAMLDALPSMNSGTLVLRTGSAPGIGSAESGTLIATLTLNSTAFAAASSRKRVANSIADVTSVASGTPGYGRFKTSGGTAVADIKAGGSWVITFSSSSGLLGTTNVAHSLVDDTAVEVFAEGAGTLPTGLSANTTYYVRSASGSTLKFATTAGGSAIAYTDAGSGTLRLKLATTGIALQSADGSVAAGITVGVASAEIRIPNQTL